MTSIGDGSARALNKLLLRCQTLEAEAEKIPELQAEVERLRAALEEAEAEMYVFRRNGWKDVPTG